VMLIPCADSREVAEILNISVDPPDPLNWKLLGLVVLTVLFGVSTVSWASSAFIVDSKLPMVIGTLETGDPPPLKSDVGSTRPADIGVAAVIRMYLGVDVAVNRQCGESARAARRVVIEISAGGEIVADDGAALDVRT
jgi:hypothetical protein